MKTATVSCQKSTTGEEYVSDCRRDSYHGPWSTPGMTVSGRMSRYVLHTIASSWVVTEGLAI